MPVAVGTKLTEHVAEPAAPSSVQEEGENEPVLELDHATAPVGVSAPPASVTVAVHVVLRPVTREEGEHDTDVELTRFATASDTAPTLGKCVGSPAYVPVTVCEPLEPGAGVNVTEHAVTPFPPSGEQLDAENDPGRDDDQATVPPGAPSGCGPNSMIVAVQVAGSAIVAVSQETLVEVIRLSTTSAIRSCTETGSVRR